VRDRADSLAGRLLDAGCGSQPYRELFRNVDQYVGLDLPPACSVDACGDAMRLPFGQATFDAVLSNEVLEHLPEPKDFMREAGRVLRPGGLLLLTTVQTWGLHHEPHDYYRYTEYGLRYLAETSGFEVIEIVPTCGLWATLAQRMADTLAYTYVKRRGPRRAFVSVAVAPALLLGWLLDRLCGTRGDTLDHVMLARKPNEQ